MFVHHLPYPTSIFISNWDHTEKKDEDKAGKASSNDESSTSIVKEAKLKQPTESTAKVDLLSTPKAKPESFKRKLESEKIVVNMLKHVTFYLL